jgi:hypothetical protein
MPIKLSNLNFFIFQDRDSSVSRPLRVRGILWCHGRVALRSFFRGRLPGIRQTLSLTPAPQCYRVDLFHISVLQFSLARFQVATRTRRPGLGAEVNGLVRELQNCSQRAQNDQAVKDRLQECTLPVFRAHEQGVGRFFEVVLWLPCFHRYFSVVFRKSGYFVVIRYWLFN